MPLLREGRHLHSVVEERIIFEQVDDVEPHFHRVLYADAEVEPLQVPLGVDVVVQHQIVFVVGHLVGCQQIAALEVRIKRYQTVLLVRTSHLQPKRARQ